jgi:hypothetical protein
LVTDPAGHSKPAVHVPLHSGVARPGASPYCPAGHGICMPRRIHQPLAAPRRAHTTQRAEMRTAPNGVMSATEYRATTQEYQHCPHVDVPASLPDSTCLRHTYAGPRGHESSPLKIPSCRLSRSRHRRQTARPSLQGSTTLRQMSWWTSCRHRDAAGWTLTRVDSSTPRHTDPNTWEWPVC